MSPSKSDIPQDTQYCYEQTDSGHRLCPFWEKHEDSDDGKYYCAFEGEYDEVLLWDQVKICDVGVPG
jgi:hypothetical protein